MRTNVTFSKRVRIAVVEALPMLFCLGLSGLCSQAIADDLRCGSGWTFDGNGFVGTLNVVVDGSGNLTGDVYGDPIQGFYNNVTNEITFIRSPDVLQQVFTGYYWREGNLDVLAGSFEALTATGGGTAARHRFGFGASCSIIAGPIKQSSTRGLDSPAAPRDRNGIPPDADKTSVKAVRPLILAHSI